MTKRRKLIVGEKAWCLSNGLLYLTEITETRTIGEDDICPLDYPFTMYKVKSGHVSVDDRSQHRSDLFAFPEEKEFLCKELDDLEDRFRRYREDLENTEEHDDTLGLQ